jgi:hypothetical protein
MIQLKRSEASQSGSPRIAPRLIAPNHPRSAWLSWLLSPGLLLAFGRDVLLHSRTLRLFLSRRLDLRPLHWTDKLAV